VRKNGAPRLWLIAAICTVMIWLASCSGAHPEANPQETGGGGAGDGIRSEETDRDANGGASGEGASDDEHFQAGDDESMNGDRLNIPYDDLLNREAEWIAGLQLASGAVPMYSAPNHNNGTQYKIVPYFAHFGLLGLLEKPEHAPVVRRYADWYFAHLNREPAEGVPAGSVFDYTADADRRTETPTGDFDSTDSYAATFLSLLRKYAEATGDEAYLIAHRDDIFLVAEAMVATKEKDGLTWAKPSYRVKYLMDNSEVYMGLADMEWICRNVFGDEAAAEVWRKHKEEVYAAIRDDLWNESRQAYAVAKMEDGKLHTPDWTRFYPDATAQLFPIWTGVLEPDSDRAKELYERFNEHFPGWVKLDKGDAFPWAIIAYTAAVMGDRERTDQFLDAVQKSFIEKGHPWPWYVMESGATMLAAAKMQREAAAE